MTASAPDTSAHETLRLVEKHVREAALFEWCQVAGTPEFKQISALARETQA